MSPPAPHDLIWIDSPRQLACRQPVPAWVTALWSPRLPLVVRRDCGLQERIPVGVRGTLRSERAAAWVNAGDITRVVSPEMLVQRFIEQPSGESEALPVMRALRKIASLNWPWAWGVTGSCGYMLASGVGVCRADSDLDLLIRCPRPMVSRDFSALMDLLPMLPCRMDIQLETPMGGVALAEWLRGGKVMVKTSGGPLLADDPWRPQRRNA